MLQYQILGVDRRAPIEVIKKAYRAKVIPFASLKNGICCKFGFQAKEFHPDKHATAAPEEKVTFSTSQPGSDQNKTKF